MVVVETEGIVEGQPSLIKGKILPVNEDRVKLKVLIDTDLVQDTFFIRTFMCESLEKLLQEIHRRYSDWHGFPVYEFELQRASEGKLEGEAEEEKAATVGDLVRIFREKTVVAVESQSSRFRREEDKRREEEKKLKREMELREKEEKRRQKILELVEIGNCWSFENVVPSLDVPIENDGLLVKNRGSVDQWCPIHRVRPILGTGKSFFAVKIVKDPPTTNTWRFCVGVIPMGFKMNAERRWIGSQKSWSYIAGNGGKCHNSGKNESYGSKYGEGDVVGVYLNFDEGTIEFFKNGVSQGIAFRNLTGPVYLAVAMTAKDAEISLVDDYPASLSSIIRLNQSFEELRIMRWKEISDEKFHNDRAILASKGENSWDVRFSLNKDRSLYYPDDLVQTVINEGSADKWRSARSIGTYERGICFFELSIDKDTATVNTWRICIGVIPSTFSCDGPRAWVGSQESWGYIAGTGGKSYNSGQSVAYGEPYEEGDVVGVLLNFEESTIEFFRNGVSQGIAFNNLIGPVHAAVSLTGTNAQISLRNVSLEQFEQYRVKASERASRITSIIQKFGNVWDPKKCSKDLVLEDNGLKVLNPGSGNKWRSVASLLPYSSGRRYFEIIINDNPYCSNTWRIVVGVVPRSFDFDSPKLWVGAQNSWGYIGGTGGKCRNSGKSISYGSKFQKGDKIGCLLDFENKTIEFYKNGVSQGSAFQDLTAPVFAAVSITAGGACVTLDASCEGKQALIDSLFLYK